MWEAEFFELGTGDVDVKVFTFCEGLTVDFRLMGSRENSLGLLALGSKSSHGSCVTSDINASLLLELSNAEVDENIVEIFTTQVSMSVGSLDLENSILDREKGDIEGTTTEIEDEDVPVTLVLLVKTVSNSGSSWLVNDTLDVEACNCSGILGSLSLGIVEVSWDSDDSILDSFSEVSLSNFLHLGEDHR